MSGNLPKKSKSFPDMAPLSAGRRDEFSLIGKIRKCGKRRHSSLLMSIGDDCAVFDPAFARRLVVTTDLLVEDVHFKRDWLSPYLLGRKSVAVNWSDVAAMGARPYACLLSLVLPRTLRGRFFDDFIHGVVEGCDRVGASLIGGDLSSGASLVVAVTAWGYVESGEPCYRSAARPEDRILLIGEVGFARKGLEILETDAVTELKHVRSEGEFNHCFEDSGKLPFLKAHCLPEPPIEAAVWLQQHEMVHAIIDVSDGLAQDLLHLCRESGVAAELQLEAVISKRLSPRRRARELTLNGGEDYALLFSVSPRQLIFLQQHYPSDLPPFRVIGSFFAGDPGVYLRHGGNRKLYQPKGFNHFQ